MVNASSVAEYMKIAKTLFFVGIGGISMSSLAMVCKGRGYTVKGSDRAVSDMTDKLEKAGIPIVHCHDEKNIEGADAVIYTGAVTMENPELRAAKRKGLPMISRADLLGYIMRGYENRVGVAGMHGKSTCTSMLAHLFMAAGKNPTVLSGAETDEMGGAYTVGGKEHFLFEACEYKDSFLHFFPTISVILNMDIDHTDYFTGGLPQIKKSFLQYANIPYQNGEGVRATVIFSDDENSRELLPHIENPVTFGIADEKADYRAFDVEERDGRASFTVMKEGTAFCRISLMVVGYHHIYNALAATAVCDLLGFTPEEIETGLATFTGLRRRFEYKKEVNGAKVYIDYAHHPKEIAATVKGAREMTKGHLYCFFEPHTYSRTAALFDDFCNAFTGADRVYYLDIYAAREKNTFGVSSEQLASHTENGFYLPSYEAAAEKIREIAGKDDTVLILGAGTVNKIADFA